MQTFLPVPSFSVSAIILDRKRLWKQVLEARAILEGKWISHPASRMWRGHDEALKDYINCCMAEWRRRGYFHPYQYYKVQQYEMPWWFGLDKFHASHRSNLLRKDCIWYGYYGWVERPGLPYYWPTPRKETT